MGNAIVQTSSSHHDTTHDAKYVVSGQDTLQTEEEPVVAKSPVKKEPKPQQDVYFISTPNLKTTDSRLPRSLPSIKEVVTPIISGPPSAKKAPPGERTRTIILSKAHETEVVKQMQFTHLASHMKVTHQSRSLSKLAPYRDCSLSLNHNGTHNIHSKNKILDSQIQHASEELNSNVKDQRVLLNIFKNRLESPNLEQSRNVKVGGYWSAQEKYRSAKTIITKKEALVKFFDVNPFDESPSSAVAKKAAEFAHRQLSMGVISD